MSEAHQKVARFERYVAADANNPTLWIAFGDALHEAGMLERAEQAFLASIEHKGRADIAHGRLASVAITRSDFARAEQMLRELLGDERQDPALVFNLAMACYYQRKFEQALGLFEKLVEHDPHAVGARYYVISCLHNLLREQEAIERCRQYLSAAPHPKLRGYLALVQMDAGHMEDACEQARLTLAEEPDNTDAAAVLSTHCIETQQVEEAERLLKVLAAKEPNNVRGWQGLALTSLSRQQHDQAIEYLKQAIAVDVNNVGNYATLGWVHVTRHAHAEAEEIFRKGIDIDRTEAELHGGLAVSLVFQRRLQEAEGAIARARGLDRRCFGAAFARSVILQLKGKNEQATQIMARVLQSSTRDAGPTLLDGLVSYWKHQNAATARKPHHRRLS